MSACILFDECNLIITKLHIYITSGIIFLCYPYFNISWGATVVAEYTIALSWNFAYCTTDPPLSLGHISSQSTSLTVSISLAEGVTATFPYIISYININNTHCFHTSVSGITTNETEYTLSGLEEDTTYNITVTVMVTGGVTAEDSFTATTLTAG